MQQASYYEGNDSNGVVSGLGYAMRNCNGVASSPLGYPRNLGYAPGSVRGGTPGPSVTPPAGTRGGSRAPSDAPRGHPLTLGCIGAENDFFRKLFSRAKQPKNM